METMQLYLGASEGKYPQKLTTVSYTHLDVYKRQARYCLSFREEITYQRTHADAAGTDEINGVHH